MIASDDIGPHHTFFLFAKAADKDTAAPLLKTTIGSWEWIQQFNMV